MTYLNLLRSLPRSNDTRYFKSNPHFDYLDVWLLARQLVIPASRYYCRREKIRSAEMNDLMRRRDGRGFDERIKELDELYYKLSEDETTDYDATVAFYDKVLAFWNQAMGLFDPENYTEWMYFPPGDLDIHLDLVRFPPSVGRRHTPDGPEPPF
ncbi:MAG: hypothetical protein IH628_07930 [Proteobacteria bacterium]|nr:hypothetical protein [Pseudomonadota bacterium]